MPSPFPGMDPYLEDGRLWPLFQHQFATCLYQILLPGLVDRYRARIGQRRYATEQPLFTSVVRDDHEEEFVEIRHRSDGRLVTLIDIVSPTNRTTDRGRQAYLERRREARSCGANLVEIDLVLQGTPMLDYTRSGLADWDYAVTVTRATQPERVEIFTATLQKALPRFRLPLLGDDQSTIMDLRTVFARTYDQGNFGNQIDYQRDPPTTVTDQDRVWIDKLLRQHKVR